MIEFLKQTFGDAVTEEVISQFRSELGKKFVAKADYNTKRDELNSARETIATLQSEAEGLKSRAAEADRFETDMTELKKKYDEHITVLNSELEQVKLENEISGLIRKSGGRNEKAVRALITPNGENTMKSVAQQLDLLKKSDPYLFDGPTPGGTKGNFPRNDSAPQGTLTYSQMMKLEANR